jgi:hypothetical protein
MDTDAIPMKLILTYDLMPGRREEYLKYIRGKFVPMLEQLGLKMCDNWHTAYGSHPLRLAAFLAAERVSLQRIVDSEVFQDLEAGLQDYVINYNRKIVPLRPTFQY